MRDYFCLDELYSNGGEKELYKKLKSLKKEIFPNDYRLEIDYNFDIINNNDYPGKFLESLVKNLVDIDIPMFFVEIKTSYNKVVPVLGAPIMKIGGN